MANEFISDISGVQNRGGSWQNIYNAHAKSDILDYAEAVGRPVAGQHYEIHPSTIARWAKDRDSLKAFAEGQKRTRQHFEANNPELIGQLDDQLVAMINEGKCATEWDEIRKCAQKLWRKLDQKEKQGVFTDKNEKGWAFEMFTREFFTMGSIARFVKRNKGRLPKIRRPRIDTNVTAKGKQEIGDPPKLMAHMFPSKPSNALGCSTSASSADNFGILSGRKRAIQNDDIYDDEREEEEEFDNQRIEEDEDDPQENSSNEEGENDEVEENEVEEEESDENDGLRKLNRELENSQKLRQLPLWSYQDELAMRVTEITQLKTSTHNGTRMAGGTYLTKVLLSNDDGVEVEMQCWDANEHDEFGDSLIPKKAYVFHNVQVRAVKPEHRRHNQGNVNYTLCFQSKGAAKSWFEKCKVPKPIGRRN